jgi:hypothetical protein
MPLEPTQGGATDGAGERDAPQESGRDAPPPTDPAGSDSLDGLRATLTKERSERERLQREVAKLVAAQTKVDDAKKSDVERLTAEIARVTGERDQLAAAAATRRIRDHLTDAAERAQARRPATVAKLIADDVELSDDGTPTRDSVRAALDTLKKTDPDLFRAIGSADGAARGNGPPDTANMNAIIRRAAGRG